MKPNIPNLKEDIAAQRRREDENLQRLHNGNNGGPEIQSSDPANVLTRDIENDRKRMDAATAKTLKGE